MMTLLLICGLLERREKLLLSSGGKQVNILQKQRATGRPVKLAEIAGSIARGGGQVKQQPGLPA